MGTAEHYSRGGKEHFNQYWEQLNPKYSYLGSLSLLCTQPKLTHAPELKEVSRIGGTKGVYQAKTSVCLSGMASVRL